MIKTRVEWNGWKIRVHDNAIEYAPAFDARVMTVRAEQLLGLGKLAVDMIMARTAEGVGSDDQPMPGLKPHMYKGRRTPGYPEFKSKLGLKPIRDLRGPGGRTVTVIQKSGWSKKSAQKSGTGHMMDDLRVLSVTDHQVQYGISNYNSRVKARRNDVAIQRMGGHGWFGLSPSEVRRIEAAMRQIFGEMFQGFKLQFFGVKKIVNAQAPIWMDPMGIRSAIVGRLAARDQ